MMEKKEMVYNGDLEPEILYADNYKGYNYYVVSYGSHPCGYVEIPEGHPFYNVDYDSLDIKCHGGLTFADKHKLEGIDGKYCIGWDYAHAGDFMDYGAGFNFSHKGFHFNDLTKYTTDDVINDCEDVIDQIISSIS